MYKKSVAIIVPALFAAAVLVSSNAAATKINISGTWSRSQIKKDCDSVGGSCDNCSGKSGPYSCSNLNNNNTVYCNSGGKCIGWIPRKSNPPHTLSGVLHTPSGGIKSSGGNAPPQGHRPPVKITGFRPPSGVKTTGGNNGAGTIMRHEEHHFGGHR